MMILKNSKTDVLFFNKETLFEIEIQGETRKSARELLKVECVLILRLK